MIGKIEQITKSKSGKAWRVLVDKRWFGAQFDSKLDSIPIGSMIDFDFNSDPKYGDWITTWGPARVENTTLLTTKIVPAPPPQAAVPFPPLPAIPKSNGDRWWLPFVSNQCAHAIAAGLITTPEGLKTWAEKAREAADAADDSLPF